MSAQCQALSEGFHGLRWFEVLLGGWFILAGVLHVDTYHVCFFQIYTCLEAYQGFRGFVHIVTSDNDVIPR